jgi:hypothetical protein
MPGMPEYDYGPALRLEQRIDRAEAEGIEARWEFGRWMLTHVSAGRRKLPDGFLAGLARATGKSERELRYRAQFARECSALDAVRQRVAEYGSWHELVEHLGGRTPTPRRRAPRLRRPDLLFKAVGRQRA